MQLISHQQAVEVIKAGGSVLYQGRRRRGLVMRVIDVPADMPAPVADPAPSTDPTLAQLQQLITSQQAAIAVLQQQVAELSTAGRGATAALVEQVKAAVLAELPVNQGVTAGQVESLIEQRLVSTPTSAEVDELRQQIAALPSLEETAAAAALLVPKPKDGEDGETPSDQRLLGLINPLIPNAASLASAAAALVLPPSDERLRGLITPLVPTADQIVLLVPQPTDQRLLGLIAPLVPTAAQVATFVPQPTDDRLRGLIGPLVPTASQVAGLVPQPTDDRLRSLITPLIPPAIPGNTGKSAYESYRALGGQLSEAAWLASLVGPPGTTDHSQLTNLAVDSHPQYFNQTRGDTRYGQLAVGNLWAAGQKFSGASGNLGLCGFSVGFGAGAANAQRDVVASGKGLLGVGLLGEYRVLMFRDPT